MTPRLASASSVRSEPPPEGVIPSNGTKFGRPAKLNTDQAALAQRMKENGETAATICKTLGIGRTTLYRYLDATD